MVPGDQHHRELLFSDGAMGSQHELGLFLTSPRNPLNLHRGSPDAPKPNQTGRHVSDYAGNTNKITPPSCCRFSSLLPLFPLPPLPSLSRPHLSHGFITVHTEERLRSSFKVSSSNYSPCLLFPGLKREPGNPLLKF